MRNHFQRAACAGLAGLLLAAAPAAAEITTVTLQTSRNVSVRWRRARRIA